MKKGKKKFSQPILLASVFACGVMLICFNEASVNGALIGLRVCASVVIPSLFPLLVLSSFGALSSDCKAAMAFLSPVMRHVFRLPAVAAPAVLFGLLGGYPAGCTAAVQLLEKGEINKEQAQRICCFCINAGPAFVITAVGTVMLGSVKSGVIIFASVVLACIMLGALLGLAAEKPPKMQQKPQKDITNVQALVQATEASAYGIIKICAWTVLFSAVSEIIESLGLSEIGTVAVECILEVTGGCMAAVKTGNVCIAAAALGWGGLCVGCQLLGAVRKAELPVSVFFSFRVFHAAVSAVICAALLRLFPIEQSVFSNTAAVSVKQFSYSVPATVALLCMCAVFVIDLDRNKKIC